MELAIVTASIGAAATTLIAVLKWLPKAKAERRQKREEDKVLQLVAELHNLNQHHGGDVFPMEPGSERERIAEQAVVQARLERAPGLHGYYCLPGTFRSPLR